jgi:hypothetical protein
MTSSIFARKTLGSAASPHLRRKRRATTRRLRRRIIANGLQPFKSIERIGSIALQTTKSLTPPSAAGGSARDEKIGDTGGGRRCRLRACGAAASRDPRPRRPH